MFFTVKFLILWNISVKDLALVAPEAPSEQARRVFQTYDPEGKLSRAILCMYGRVHSFDVTVNALYVWCSMYNPVAFSWRQALQSYINVYIRDRTLYE